VSSVVFDVTRRTRRGGGYRRCPAEARIGRRGDPLLAVLREGAKRMPAQTVGAEVEALLAAPAGPPVDRQGRRRSVRDGHAPERRLRTGIGPRWVRRPKLRDRGSVADGGPIRFASAVLPAYLRRTKDLEGPLPWLYLTGVSTGASSRRR
jgi:putative transposase